LKADGAALIEREAGAASRDKTERVDHFRRMGALRRKLTRAGLPGLLVTHPPDVRYLCGFTGSSAALAVTRRDGRLFTDGRYTAQAAEEVKAAQVQIASGSPAVAACNVAAQAQSGVAVAGIRPARTTVAELARWKSELPSRLRRGFLQAAPAPLVETLRW
jgi:Xaa-Pro aminopeptidase